MTTCRLLNRRSASCDAQPLSRKLGTRPTHVRSPEWNSALLPGTSEVDGSPYGSRPSGLFQSYGAGAASLDAAPAPSSRYAEGQACCSLMLTSHVMPNRSVHIPNTSPHICFSIGTVTVPPEPDSFSQ